MSKYEEVCNAYMKGKKDFIDYRDSCYKFTEQLKKGMINYLQWPEKQVDYIPLKENVDRKRKYTLRGTMNLNKDTFWHIGILFTIIASDDKTDKYRGVLPLLVKKDNDKFIVKIEGNEREFKIDIGNQNELNVFYKYVLVLIKEPLENRLQHVLDKNKTINNIGFRFIG